MKNLEPLDWILAAGCVLAAILVVLTPIMIAEFSPSEDVLPCPAAFKSDLCTSEMAHAPRSH